MTLKLSEKISNQFNSLSIPMFVAMFASLVGCFEDDWDIGVRQVTSDKKIFIKNDNNPEDNNNGVHDMKGSNNGTGNEMGNNTNFDMGLGLDMDGDNPEPETPGCIEGIKEFIERDITEALRTGHLVEVPDDPEEPRKRVTFGVELYPDKYSKDMGKEFNPTTSGELKEKYTRALHNHLPLLEEIVKEKSNENGVMLFTNYVIDYAGRRIALQGFPLKYQISRDGTLYPTNTLYGYAEIDDNAGLFVYNNKYYADKDKVSIWESYWPDTEDPAVCLIANVVSNKMVHEGCPVTCEGFDAIRKINFSNVRLKNDVEGE